MNFETVLQIVNTLTEDQKQALLIHLQEDQSATNPGQRVLDLHAGAIQMREDFDDELPDRFWLDEA